MEQRLHSGAGASSAMLHDPALACTNARLRRWSVGLWVAPVPGIAPDTIFAFVLPSIEADWTSKGVPLAAACNAQKSPASR